MPVPCPIRLFHIAAIANLPNICQKKALLSKNLLATQNVAYQNIAYQGAQSTRSVKPVPNPPGGVVHDYVPLYFAPRSPMLLAVNSGKVPGCSWKQNDIIYFETTVERVTVNNAQFVFYDRNATLTYSTPYTDLARLDAIAWDLLMEKPLLDGFCKYWHNNGTNMRYVDRMERRQAEFLVKNSISLASILNIGVIDEGKAQQVNTILTRYAVSLPVIVKEDWFFIGQ